MEARDWERFFAQYDRTSIDEVGTVTSYSNQMEEIYQMFKARLIKEMTNDDTSDSTRTVV